MEQQMLSEVGALIKAIVCGMVDRPQAVRVEEVRGSQTVVLEVQVAPTDLPKIIGKQGRTAQAIRDLLTNLGGKHQRRYRLSVVEERWGSLSAPQRRAE